MAGKFLKILEGKARNARPKTGRKNKFAKSHLEVRMFNVGEGEAILLVFPNKPVMHNKTLHVTFF